MSAKNKSFVGVLNIMKQRHDARPGNFEPRRGLNPKIAAKNKWNRIEAIYRHKEFQFEYRQAFKQFQNGVQNVIFPAGTYALRLNASVKCAPG